MSTNRGTARSYRRQLADATKLKGVVMTSSPSPIPSARTHRWSPAVPLEQATPSRRPAAAATPASNRCVYGPMASTSLRRTRETSSSSREPMSGLARGMLRPKGLMSVVAPSSEADTGSDPAR